MSENMISDDTIAKVAGGNDPETMSEEELNALISHYQNLRERFRGMASASSEGNRDLSRSAGACDDSIIALTEIRKRRFGY